jgi:hypothetical protein
MFIENVPIDTTVEKRDRNFRIEVCCDLESGPDYLLRACREIVLIKDGKRWETGGANGEEQYVVEKRLSEILNETVTIPDGQGGTVTLSGGQIALALETLSDKFAKLKP